ncbi:MAG: type II secretion system F family protein [Phycisphaerales bacterium]
MNLLRNPWAVPALAAAIAMAMWYWALVMPALRAERAKAASGADAAQPPAPVADRHWIEGRAFNFVGIAAWLVVTVLGGSEGLAFASFAVSFGAVSVSRSRIRARRAEREEREVLEAIGTAAVGLRAGLPLAGVLQILAAESGGEPGRAFREVVRRESMGQDLSGAVERVLVGSRLMALRGFGLALMVHASAGGNLSAASDRIARSLIDRARIRRRSRTILAYGMFAANFLAVAPVLAFLVIGLQLEEYADLMLNRPVGHLLMGMAAALVVVGLVTVRRMSSFERLEEGGLR